MEINKYIFEYLNEYNTSVVVPDLGRFSIIRKPSEIKDGVVVPPVKSIEFDSNKTDDDGVFTRYLAKKASITQEQAAEEVRMFYNKYFLQKLTINRQPISFDQLGTFSLHAGNIVFEPVANFFKDNFGLGNAYISSEAKPQPPPIPPQVVAPKPEPVIPKPEPVQPQTETSSQPVQPKSDDSGLFNMNDARYRENTERRRQVPPLPEQRQEPPVPPQQARKKEIAKRPPKPQKKQKEMKEKKEKTSNGSNRWVFWVILIAIVLGVGAYFGYPYIESRLPTGIASLFAKKPIYVEPAETSIFADDDGFFTDSINGETDQGLDDSTDKRNALNPNESPSASSPATTSSSQPLQTQTASVPQSKSGRWFVIIGSFGTQSAAETFGKKAQAEDGLNYEVIFSGNLQRYRVSAGRFDTEAEAKQLSSQIRAKYGNWVVRL